MSSETFTLEDIAEILAEAGKRLEGDAHGLPEVIEKTEMYNPWFTADHCNLMLQSFRDHYFAPEKLKQWISNYSGRPLNHKTTGLVFAGNVPFVGMADLLAVLMSGNSAMIKLSSKDSFFFPWFAEQLTSLSPVLGNRVVFTERLKDFDNIIATGSNNAARYFHYYFDKYPHIIRKNRTSVAIIHKDISDAELLALGKDVFYYYGLGCRNVGKLFLPDTFDITRIFEAWAPYAYVMDNTKYKNNYDYNRALLLLNKTEHFANDFFMLQETADLFSPLSVLYFSKYADTETLQTHLDEIAGDLQCVVASGAGNTAFGYSQFPELWDYADHVDTLDFLLAH
ncbi:MAG: acyl-CoA reductase [Chitinophagales bacterium]